MLPVKVPRCTGAVLLLLSFSSTVSSRLDDDDDLETADATDVSSSSSSDYTLQPTSCSDPSTGCCDDPALIVYVSSAATNFPQRQAVWSTWGSVDRLTPLSVRLVFVLSDLLSNGSTRHSADKTLELGRRLVAEHRQHGDLMQIGAPGRLARWIGAWRWAVTSDETLTKSYVLTVADDTYIKVDGLLHVLADL